VTALAMAPVTAETDHTRSVLVAGRTGLVAAALWLVLAAESVVRGGSQEYRDILWMAPWVATVAMLALVYRAQRSRLRAWGRLSFLLVGITMTLVLVGQLGSLLDNDAMLVFYFPLGPVLWLLSMVPAGIATVRAGVVPRRVGVLIAAFEAISMATGVALSPVFGLADGGDYSSIGIGKGLVVLAIALSLLAGRRRGSR
jgi:hypothetical protein